MWQFTCRMIAPRMRVSTPVHQSGRSVRFLSLSPWRCSEFGETSYNGSVGFDDEFGIPTVNAKQRIPIVISELCKALKHQGYYHKRNFLGETVALAMRADAERLLATPNRFVASESIDKAGVTFKKHNVFSCELDGHEWDVASHLLAYTREVMLTLPKEFSKSIGDNVKLSDRAYGSKLAVALGEGSAYPKHVDNGCVETSTSAEQVDLADARQLTFIYYMNPHHHPSDGGQLRIWPHTNIDAADTGVDDKYGDDDGGRDKEIGGGDDDNSNDDKVGSGGDDVDCDKPVLINPTADTLVAFWSDTVVHDVLANTTAVTCVSKHRYALTLWLVAESTIAGTSRLCDRSDSSWKSVERHFPTGNSVDADNTR